MQAVGITSAAQVQLEAPRTLRKLVGMTVFHAVAERILDEPTNGGQRVDRNPLGRATPRQQNAADNQDGARSYLVLLFVVILDVWPQALSESDKAIDEYRGADEDEPDAVFRFAPSRRGGPLPRLGLGHVMRLLVERPLGAARAVRA